MESLFNSICHINKKTNGVAVGFLSLNRIIYFPNGTLVFSSLRGVFVVKLSTTSD